MVHLPGYAYYQLGGIIVQFEYPVKSLEPFRIDTETNISQYIKPSINPRTLGQPDIQAEGWLLDRHVIISLWEDERGFQIDIPEEGRYLVTENGEAVFTDSIKTSSDEEYQLEALLGPPLILALALQDVWCLHASAVIDNGKAVVFLGDSGAGKSTLAAYLSRQPGVHLAADDILPVAMKGSKLSALPHFPQLKLSPDSQPGVNLPEAVPISAVFLLEESEGISTTSIKPQESMLLLTANTVAARLFNKQLLTRHFLFCSQACVTVPVYRLAYPRIYDALPQVWQTLKEHHVDSL